MLPTKHDLEELRLRHLAAYACRSALRFRATLAMDDKDPQVMRLIQSFDAGINFLMAVARKLSPEFLYPAMDYRDDNLTLWKNFGSKFTRRLDYVSFHCLCLCVDTGSRINYTISIVERVKRETKPHPSLLRSEEGAYEMLDDKLKDLALSQYYWDFQTISELRNLCLTLRHDYNQLLDLCQNSTEPGDPIDPSNEGPLGSIWLNQCLSSKDMNVQPLGTLDDLRIWPQRRPRAFLSYASEDYEKAMRFRESLRGQGVEVWFDKYDLLPGQQWEDTIRMSIKKCDFFIAYLSENSVSKRGFVQKELKYALSVLDEFPDGEVFVIPVSIGAGKIPESLSHLHCIRIDGEIGVERVAETMLRLLKL